ncbi:MAG: 3-phosphoserine/phosphohydroxythreonine transaminase [Calditrichaeota bacterium]|nr:3-phosphoserine/phosphohydroxythreonine transaminase [Calditrichota bacterium]MCB0269313.1 3-phosphoserine/phosphohydroxythreonine transaminase [Calditrichota bacterium]
MMQRIFNFSAGPATLPLPVLHQVQEELVNFRGQGMSLMEMSHRSKTFDEVLNEAASLILDIMGFSDDYQVVFMQGGATGQFAAVPLNLSVDGRVGEYVDSGSWAIKAYKEAVQLGKPARVVASSKSSNHNHIPTDFKAGSDAAYLHICSNNTIFGTQFQDYPDTGDVPLIADMSSDLYCRRFDPKKFALIYAGAQKNAGPAGVTITIIRKDLLDRCPSNIPTVFNYKTIAEGNSMYNTPPTFPIYVVGLVMKWIKSQGGIDKIESANSKKAGLLYDALDAGDFYKPHAQKNSRSLMNITWRLPNEDLEKKFVAEATAQHMSGLKGHRSVGGIRASIYNAMPTEGVQTLVAFMKEFERTNG